MSCSKGTTHLRYRDDEAAALRAAAGRMKARTERAERAAGRAMTGSGGERKEMRFYECQQSELRLARKERRAGRKKPVRVSPVPRESHAGTTC